MSILLILFYVLSTSSGLVLLKLGTVSGLQISFINNSLKFNLNPTAVAGILLYGISFLLYIYLISKFDLGFIIPLTIGIVYVLIFIASFVIFHEVFTVTKIIAITLIIGGLILLNLNK